jgi:hypothetical protein
MQIDFSASQLPNTGVDVELVLKVSEDSDWHMEKHSEPRNSIGRGIKTDCN